MASVEFESLSRPLLFPEGSVSAAKFRVSLEAARPRLALVSTYSELCGIAAYTRSLEKQLGDVFAVTVFDLNQYLLRSACTAACANSGIVTFRRFAASSKTSTRSICSSSTARWGAPRATSFVASAGSCGRRRGSR